MHPTRNRLLGSLLFWWLAVVCAGCSKEPVTHSEELPPGRIPQMRKESAAKNAKSPKAGQAKTKAVKGLADKQKITDD
jgi:hypothetical protein